MKYTIERLKQYTYSDREASFLYIEIMREAIFYDKVRIHIDLLLNNSLFLWDDEMLIVKILLTVRNKSASRREDLLKMLVYLEQTYALHSNCFSRRRFRRRSIQGFYRALIRDLEWYRDGKPVPESLYIRYSARK